MRTIERTLTRVVDVLQDRHPTSDISHHVRGFTIECAKAALRVAQIDAPGLTQLVAKSEEGRTPANHSLWNILARAAETALRLEKEKWDTSKQARLQSGARVESEEESMTKIRYWVTAVCASIPRIDAIPAAHDAINALAPLVTFVERRRGVEQVIALSLEQPGLARPWTIDSKDDQLHTAACNMVAPLMSFVTLLDQSALRRASLAWAGEASRRVNTIPDLLHAGIAMVADAIAKNREIDIPLPLISEATHLQELAEEERKQVCEACDEDDRLSPKCDELISREWAVFTITGCLHKSTELAALTTCYSIYNLIVGQAKTRTWLPLYEYLTHLIA